MVIHGGMSLLEDVSEVWDSVLSCCWDMCFEDESDGPSDSILVERYLEGCHAVDSYPKDEPLSVQERLRERSSFWKEEFEASQFVLDIVTNGYVTLHSISTANNCKESSISTEAFQVC